MLIHPAARALPDMADDEFDLLLADIERNGLLSPIELVGGRIIDGRHREKACKKLAIKPDYVDVELNGQSPGEYVWSMNGARRHLTPSQRAAVAVKLLPELKVKAKKRQEKLGKTHGKDPCGTNSIRGTSRDQAAKLVGVSGRYVEQAAKLENESPELFEEVRQGSLTITGARQQIRADSADARRKTNARKVAAAADMDKLVGVFSTILIDPPWDWGDEGDVNQLGRAKPDYATLPLAELEKLPIPKFAAADSHLYCWVTNRSLSKVFQLIETWGFRYITMLTWPKPHYGMGTYFRGQTEHIVFAVRGSLSLMRKDASTLLPAWPRGKKGHSSKPIEIYQFIEKCSPGPYLEMFARDKRNKWTAWGADA